MKRLAEIAALIGKEQQEAARRRERFDASTGVPDVSAGDIERAYELLSELCLYLGAVIPPGGFTEGRVYRFSPVERFHIGKDIGFKSTVERDDNSLQIPVTFSLKDIEGKSIEGIAELMKALRDNAVQALNDAILERQR